jgi:2-polyprenyl-3-methyl-5-hydroxy-6-metoxy-1,4-benzoquinol methylase
MSDTKNPPACYVCGAHMALRFGTSAPNHWKCPQCRLECISPQLSDVELGEIYNPSYFAHYQKDLNGEIVRAMKRSTYRHQLRRLPVPASLPGEKKLLDCGAATGYLAELAKEMGWDAFAIEYSEFGANACLKVLGPGRVYRGQVQDSGFAANPGGQFSAITMFDFIEHVREPRAVLQWAKQRLNSQGTLLLTTPQAGSLSWRLMGPQWFHYTSREHLWFFSPKSIQILLEQSGFRAIKVRALRKAVTIGYALAHYSRGGSYSPVFTPLTRLLNAILPELVKQWRLWFYLGEMAVQAEASPLHALMLNSTGGAQPTRACGQGQLRPLFYFRPLRVPT